MKARFPVPLSMCRCRCPSLPLSPRSVPTVILAPDMVALLAGRMVP